MLKLGAVYQQLLAEVGHLGAPTPHELSAGLREMALPSPALPLRLCPPHRFWPQLPPTCQIISGTNTAPLPSILLPPKRALSWQSLTAIPLARPGAGEEGTVRSSTAWEQVPLPTLPVGKPQLR